MTDLNLSWIPSFTYGDTTIDLTYPMQQWNRGARTVGSVLKTILGEPGPVLRYQRYTLPVILRFTEAEWPSIRALIAYGQTGQAFFWSPNSPDEEVPTLIPVYLGAPRVADAVRPTRDGSMLWLMSLPIVLEKDTPWDMQYHPTVLSDGGTTPPPGPVGVAYFVTSSDYDVAPSSSVTISAQLVDESGNPVAQAGRAVSWTNVGAAGLFAPTISLTDSAGIATTVFTTGSTLDLTYTVVAVDDDGATGTADPILNAGDGLTFMRSIGSCMLLVDAISGMSGNGTNLTAVVDKSGLNRVITLPALTANKPLFDGTKWNGTHPAMKVARTSAQYIKVNMPAIGQPITIIVVMDGYTLGDVAGGGNHNIVNMGGVTNAGAIMYRGNASATWTQYAGSVAATSIVNSASLGKCIRTDVFNGATSKSYRGSTTGANTNPGALGIQGASPSIGIGARADGVDATNATIALVAIYSKVLTTQQYTDIISFLVARYPGLSST